MSAAWSELEKLLPEIEQGFFDAQTKYVHAPMREMLTYHFETGGKRLRPLLVYATALAYAKKKGKDLTSATRASAPYALAVELIHNATLIHDDLQDGDTTRRGRETLWKKYSPAQAINCGDAWFFVPQLLIQDATYGAELKLDLLHLIQIKTLAVIEGQSEEFVLKEKFAQGADVATAQYLHMVEGKTSALFSMPLLGGAKIAGASSSEQKALEHAAISLGHAFQIQDDLLDLWGDKGRGAVGSDIEEGKLSYPLVLLLHALKKGSEERRRVESIVRAPREETKKEDVLWVISLMEKMGIKDQAKADFQKHIKEAKTASLWEEVIHLLADWMEEKVSSY